jgi:hypothetical protein
VTFPLLFDDAAIFPPASLGLAEAVLAHDLHRRRSYADLVGPLVVGSSDLTATEGLVELLGLARLDLAVVVPDAAGAVAALELAALLDGVRVVALEVTAAGVADLTSALGVTANPSGDQVTTYVELPRGERCAEVVAELVGSPYRAKIRTGGVEASMHPDEAELAATVLALVEAKVPFKATAGLHHAVRHTDPETGFEQHGFLNLLLATETARQGAGVGDLAAVLAERDAARLVTLSGLSELPESSLLGSIGTCSITDPIDDLIALGLVTS